MRKTHDGAAFKRVPSFLRDAAYETMSFVAYLCLATWILWRYAEFNLIGQGGVRVASLVVALAPAAVLYLLLRLLLGNLVSLGVAGTGIALLAWINHTKMAFTGMPLSWGDLATTQNVSIVLAYLHWWQVLSVIAVSCAILILFFFAVRRELAVATLRSKVIAAGALFAILPFAFQPYLPGAPWKWDDRMAQLFEKEGIFYTPGDWRINASANGLFFHLVQTSRRPVPAALSEEQWGAFNAIPEMPLLQRTPRHVFFILCEACWYDDANFSDAFEPLRRLGFLSMRGIAPGYGGGTVNSSFEMLTSLPSRGALTGVVYQEYGLVMSPHAQTLASALRQKGYDTYALHNFMKEFWLRHIVLRKFGFERFLGIEDMRYDGPGPYPADRILYTKTLELLRQNPEKPAFFNLETMYSHWPYPFNNDFGEGNYRARLGAAVEDMAAFIKSVQEISPGALFVIYGDHKPALTKYFYERKVLPADMFVRTGDKAEDFVFQRVLNQQILGDVPVLIGGDPLDSEKLHQVKDRAASKPLYCVSAAIDELMLGSQNPAARYSLHNICDSYRKDYLDSARQMPPWLYSAMLFHPTRAD